MSIKKIKILAKAWGDCKDEGVELNSADFRFITDGLGSYRVCDVEIRGRALEKTQKHKGNDYD